MEVANRSLIRTRLRLPSTRQVQRHVSAESSPLWVKTQPKSDCDLRTPRCSRCLKRNVQCLYANEPLTASPVSSEQPGREETWASRPSSSHSALTTYRFGSLDPFDSYPQTRLPRAQVQRLIHSYEELLAQKGFQSSEVLMADSVALLRRKVEDLSLAVQDGTMNSVITLATIEVGSHVQRPCVFYSDITYPTQYGKGNIDVSHTHVEGVKRLVQLRGGINAVRQTSPLTARMVSWASMLIMATRNSKPKTMPALGTAYRLSRNPSISAPSPVSQCLRYSTALYMFIIQGPTYYPHTVIMSDVIRNLIENREQLDPSPFDIWIFTIGLAASVGTAQYQWFLERARAAATSLQLREWGHVLAHTRAILWSETLCEGDVFRPAWDDILCSPSSRAESPRWVGCIISEGSDLGSLRI
ncbi:C6 zinc finger domain-containing protein [Verticillium alfalfae VaMs.102]|uniref:C6 zinc finger domain-containing protein n=1 Tax=Verticillium alfalfae (strain VaMs.102 / ATCC MYA-4576 / FGSC 10136) TaxID=526221 RepID=C9S936_VERA1|nr:C6 zinc finger domain-containing protein [Verticillium alfalfae VaMs.102]EEY14084.1 C6 zinc finger domain-containing protein [Verticillium alfalfae VaMs.102]